MRISPIRDLLAKRGAQFREIAGREVACCFSSVAEEYESVRSAVGLTDFSFATLYRVPEEGLDVFERYSAGAVANIRFGRILHTMALSEQGMLESELYIANDDDKLILIGESLVPDDAVRQTLTELSEGGPAPEELSGSYALFGVDGFHAWAVVKELFGADVLGLPYMSIETYEVDGIEVKLFRAGKTSEFGYLLMVEAASAEALWLKLEAAGEGFEIKPVGFDAHMTLRLDGRFFNIHKEGAAVKDPLPLGLQWMADFEGDDYRGKESFMARREAGLSQKIVGLVSEGAEAPLAEGDKVLHRGTEIGTVVAAVYSPVLSTRIGLALLDVDYAYAGLDFVDANGRKLSTVSLPPFTAKSLTVRLDEM